MKGIGRKFLAVIVEKSEEAVKKYFSRNGMKKSDPDDVRKYLLKFLK